MFSPPRQIQRVLRPQHRRSGSHDFNPNAVLESTPTTSSHTSRYSSSSYQHFTFFFWLMLFFYIVVSEIRCLLLLCELIVILLLDRSTSPTKSPRSPAVGSPKDSHSGNSYNSPEHSEHNTINELGSDIIRSLSFSKIFTHYTQSFKLHSQTKRNDNISETNNQHFL